MIHSKSLAFALFLSLLLLSFDADACVCSSRGDPLDQYDIVFRGASVVSGTDYKGQIAGYFSGAKKPKHYTTFEVSQVFKGIPGQKVTVFYYKGGMTSCAFGGFEDKTEYIIYSNKHENGYYTAGTCTPRTKVKNLKEYINPHSVPGSARLNTIIPALNAIDQLIEEHPNVLEFYLKKAEILEEINDFQRLEVVYRKALELAQSQEIDSEKIRYQYGRVLYNAEKYEEALQALRKVSKADATKLYSASLLFTQKFDEINGKPVDVSGMSFSELDLSGVSLPGSNFSNTEIFKSKFDGANLSGSDFTNAKIQRSPTSFVNTNLSGARLENANLSSADLTDADLSKVQGKSAEIEGKFLGTDLSGSDFTNARFSGPMMGADLTQANFEGANIRRLAGAILNQTNLNQISSSEGMLRDSGADYSSMNLSNLNLSDKKFYVTNFKNSDFTNSDLSNAGLIGSNLQNANFTNANLTGADFSSSSHDNTDLRGADLSTAKLEGAKFTHTIYDDSTKWPEGFDPLASGARSNSLQ